MSLLVVRPVGNASRGVFRSRGVATVKCCGVAVARPRGYSRAPTPTIEQRVNTGTVPVLPPHHVSNVVRGLGSPSADRSGTGRSRRSTPSRGEPVHMGKGGSGFEKGRMLQCRKMHR